MTVIRSSLDNWNIVTDVCHHFIFTERRWITFHCYVRIKTLHVSKLYKASRGRCAPSKRIAVISYVSAVRVAVSRARITGGRGIFPPHCGYGPPCNTRCGSLGAFGASVSSPAAFFSVGPLAVSITGSSGLQSWSGGRHRGTESAETSTQCLRYYMGSTTAVGWGIPPSPDNSSTATASIGHLRHRPGH